MQGLPAPALEMIVFVIFPLVYFNSYYLTDNDY